MNIVEPLDLAAPESPQNQQSVGTKGVNHMSHHAIEHRLGVCLRNNVLNDNRLYQSLYYDNLYI